MNLSTGYPYSLIKNGLLFAYPKLDKDIKTDIVIIGGGISGALTAYYLCKAGLPCILVDSRTIGLGSTCASTSLLQYELDTKLCDLAQQIGLRKATLAYRLCHQSIDTLQAIAKKIHFSSFEKKESLYFAANKKDEKKLRTEFLFRKKAGFDVSLLNTKDIYTHFGFHNTSAILSKQGGDIDAYRLTHALLQSAISKGLQVYDRTNINNIIYHKRDIKLHTGNDHIITVKYIVNASGYEVTEFIEKKIVKLQSTYAFATENMNLGNTPINENALMWNTADPYLYMRTTTDKRIIIGGRDEDYYNPAKRDKLINRKTIQLKKDFKKLFPHIDIIPEFKWAGTFGSTSDSLPYIGQYPKDKRIYYALGFGGNGITFSVIAAEIIRDILIGKDNKNVDLFSFDR